MWQFKNHTTNFVMPEFGEYYASLVLITSCLFWAVATVAVSYSNTAPHKYAQFTQRIHLCILPALDIWMHNILQLFHAISNDQYSMLLTSAHYCSQKCLICHANLKKCHCGLWIIYTSGRNYKDEQYLPHLWREENHTTSKRIVLYATQIYKECSRKLPFSVQI